MHLLLSLSSSLLLWLLWLWLWLWLLWLLSSPVYPPTPRRYVKRPFNRRIVSGGIQQLTSALAAQVTAQERHHQSSSTETPAHDNRDVATGTGSGLSLIHI